jgi:hypothetical protein
MDTLVDFLNWAWARHHNRLSWYVRPLFILPFCYFWFPAPETPDPRAVEFLEVERRWITGPLTLAQVVLTALIPVWFIALAATLRRRFWGAAALVIAAGTALKVGWSFYVGGSSAWIIVPHRRARKRGGGGCPDLRVLADAALARGPANKMTAQGPVQALRQVCLQ